MKNYFLFVLAIVLVSCSGSTNTKPVRTKSCEMGIFTVDIPASLSPDSRNMANFSVWSDKDNFLVIENGKNVSYRYMMEQYNESAKGYRGKGYNVLDDCKEENSASFKVQKGLFMAKSCYVLTECDGIKFLVSYSGMNANIEQTKAVANSIRMRIEESQPIETKPVFENEFYKIEYPAGWKYMTNPDGVSDVYIGKGNEMFGFTIMHFETEYSLNDIVDNEKSTWKQLGISSKYNKSNIGGEQAFRCVASGNVQGIQMKNVSYSFKHKGIFYNIKFGNDPKLMDENSNVIEEIVKSFQFK